MINEKEDSYLCSLQNTNVGNCRGVDFIVMLITVCIVNDDTDTKLAHFCVQHKNDLNCCQTFILSISLFISYLMVWVTALVIVQQVNVFDVLANFAGVLIALEIDDIFG